MTQDGPALCVALPTRNRCASALAALDTVAAQLAVRDELLVLDNGSSDGTEAAVSRWLAGNVPAGRLLTVPERGLSRVRNVALAEARRDIVCFVDDDERPRAGWLEALRGAWARAGGRTAAIGGPKHLVWPAPRPRWLPDWLLYVLNGPDLGAEPRVLDQTPGRGYLSGGNMSVLRSAALEAGGFVPARAYFALLRHPDERLRPPLPTARAGEEEDLQRRLVQQGWEIAFEPCAGVDHLVPAHRLTEEFFHDFFRQRALLDAAAGRRSRITAVRLLARSVLQRAVLTALGRPDARTAGFAWTYASTLLTAPRLVADALQDSEPGASTRVPVPL